MATVLRLYSVAMVLPVCTQLLRRVNVGIPQVGAGLYIYIPVVQQLCLMLYVVRVSYK